MKYKTSRRIILPLLVCSVFFSGVQHLRQELCQHIRYYLRNVAILGYKYMIFASLLEPTAIDIILINKGNQDISE